MKLILFDNLNENEKSEAVEKIITQSTPSQDFFYMISLSVLVAIFGLLLNSIPILVGSMLIAPLLSPILSLSLGVVIADRELINRSVKTVLKSLLVGASVGIVATLIFGGLKMPENFVIANEPNLLYAWVAIAVGFAASFALIKPKLNATLPGVAIAVTLIPPIAFIGMGIATLNPQMVKDALILFIVNTLGIMFAGMITFSLARIYTKKKIAEKTVEKEEKVLEKEEKLKEKLEEIKK